MDRPQVVWYGALLVDVFTVKWLRKWRIWIWMSHVAVLILNDQMSYRLEENVSSDCPYTTSHCACNSHRILTSIENIFGWRIVFPWRIIFFYLKRHLPILSQVCKWHNWPIRAKTKKQSWNYVDRRKEELKYSSYHLHAAFHEHVYVHSPVHKTVDVSVST